MCSVVMGGSSLPLVPVVTSPISGWLAPAKSGCSESVPVGAQEGICCPSAGHTWRQGRLWGGTAKEAVARLSPLLVFSTFYYGNFETFRKVGRTGHIPTIQLPPFTLYSTGSITYLCNFVCFSLANFLLSESLLNFFNICLLLKPF